MVQESTTNHLYEILDETAEIIADHQDTTYLEALALTGENIYTTNIQQDALRQRLEPLYDRFFVEGMTAEDVRRAFQLAVLKGMKAAAQPQHQMTPDAVALFMGFLVNKIFPSHSFRILDEAVGTGNLLTAVLNQTNNQAEAAYGVEVDELLIKLSNTSANLQQWTVELFHQDALEPMLLEPVDLTIGDLPVGYYPEKNNAKKFRLGHNQDKLYSPYLMIEQGLKYTRQAGYLIYLIPNGLFDWDDDKELHGLLKDEAVVLGLLQLPQTMFKQEQHAKSILILQKQGQGVHKPEQAMLAQLPSFQNEKALAGVMQQIDDWFQEHLFREQ
ncbi:class I SAM-dependent methyltransferase [Tuberibacillus sp. Marseille-P3662]|uniref:class I SAM-dependent methyltransferase n=1 Tax=Tuberibacillus sp. Marseille-P3662 TaxID=1965358 RepID=UPI000A1CA9D3|nr:class I SAM-dependent methyltransferase [Tuberibacillus sp. Marseille-P3662]